MRAVLALSLLVCASVVTLAQTPAGPLPMPKLQFLDSSGRPLAGGKVYTYTAGTSTPLATYTDSSGTVANSNPVILDAGGFGAIWVKSGVYKVVIQNSAGVQQWSADNVSNSGVVAQTSGAGSLLYTPAGGGVARTIAARLGDSMSVTDFGAAGDNSTDNSAAFATAAAWASAVQGRTLTCPDGNYKYSSGLAFTLPTTFRGAPGCVLNYLGTGNAIELGSSSNTSSSIQYAPYILEGFQLTGGATMTEGIYVFQYVVNTLFKDLVVYNFGNAAAWNIFYQVHNWYNVIDGLFMYANVGFNRAWNGVRLNGATSTQQDNGTSRLNITNSFLQNFDFATTPGTGVYLNGNQCSVTDSTIAGFGPHVQLGNYGHNIVLRHNWLESSHNLTSYLIEFGDPAGIGYGAFIGGALIEDNVLVPHQADQFANFKVAGPVSGTQVFTGVRLLNNTVITLSAGTPIVTENNLTGYTQNYAQNTLLMTCIACGATSAAGQIHSTGSNIPVWAGPDGDGFAVTGTVNSAGDVAAFANAADAGGSLSLKVGKTSQQFATLNFRDYNGNLIGGMQASGAGLANRLSLLGPGNVLGAQVLSTGQLSIPSGIDASGGGMKIILAQGLGCSTAASVGATCTTGAISLPGTAFPNTSYALSCTMSSTSGVPTIVGVTKSTASFTLTVAALTASVASGSVDCVALHW